MGIPLLAAVVLFAWSAPRAPVECSPRPSSSRWPRPSGRRCGSPVGERRYRTRSARTRSSPWSGMRSRRASCSTRSWRPPSPPRSGSRRCRWRRARGRRRDRRVAPPESRVPPDRAAGSGPAVLPRRALAGRDRRRRHHRCGAAEVAARQRETELGARLPEHAVAPVAVRPESRATSAASRPCGRCSPPIPRPSASGSCAPSSPARASGAVVVGPPASPAWRPLLTRAIRCRAGSTVSRSTRFARRRPAARVRRPRDRARHG